jgi:hypothetical protein
MPMKEETIDRLILSYFGSYYADEDYYIRERAKQIMRWLLMDGYSIADIKNLTSEEIESLEIDWQNILAEPTDFIAYQLYNKEITKPSVVSYLKKNVRHTEIEESKAEELTHLYIPEQLDHLYQYRHLRMLSRYILQQLLLKGFNITDIQIMDETDLEAIDVEWLGQKPVAKDDVLKTLKEASYGAGGRINRR